MKQLAIAVDIGGTHTRAALINSVGRILNRTRILTQPQLGLAAGLEEIASAIHTVIGTTPPEQISGIGVATPGLVDPWQGIAFSPVNLPGWEDVRLKDVMESRFKCPTRVGNDANLAALGEYRFGAGRGSRNMIYLTISTGIGGGIINEGQLVLGRRGFAGEVGHCTIDANGPRCRCGNLGCLEAMASGSALARDARAAIADGQASLMLRLAGGDPNAIDGEIIAQAVVRGDDLAKRLVDRAGVYIGIAIVNLMYIFDTELFVLGGGVSNLGDPLFAAIKRTVAERALPVARQDVPIVPAALGDDAGLLGAAALVFHPGVIVRRGQTQRRTTWRNRALTR